jgi:hypothetical protein
MARIFVPTLKAQAESYRRTVKDRLGDKYEARVAPFASLLVQQYWRYYDAKIEKDVEWLANDLIGIVRGRKRQQGLTPSPWIRAIILTAMLEVYERDMLDAKKRPKPPTPKNVPDDPTLDFDP